MLVNRLLLLFLTVFTIGLSGNELPKLDFCGVDSFEQKSLLANLKEAREKKDYKKLKSVTKTLKCLNIQNKYNRYATDDILDSKSNQAIYKAIVYLNKFDKDQSLGQIISDIKNSNIRQISNLFKLKGYSDVFGLDIGWKKGKRQAYFGIFYLKGKKVKYKQWTADKDDLLKYSYNKLSKRIVLSNLKYFGFKFANKKRKPRVALAYLLEGGLDLFINSKSVEDYLAENQVHIFLDETLILKAPFLKVSGITPKLEEVGNYLRDGKYSFSVRYGEDYELEDTDTWSSKVTLDFPEENEVRVKTVKREKYVAENTTEKAELKRAEEEEEDTKYKNLPASKEFAYEHYFICKAKNGKTVEILFNDNDKYDNFVKNYINSSSGNFTSSFSMTLKNSYKDKDDNLCRGGTDIKEFQQ